MLHNENRPLHFLLRYSDKLAGSDTISEHRAILNSQNYALIGKFGLGSSVSIVNQATKNISAGIGSYLYLMSGGTITHRCRICNIFASDTGAPQFTPKQSHLIPEYYRRKKCKLWFLVDNINDSESSVSDFYLYNSPGQKPSAKGMRGLVYITTETIESDREKTIKAMDSTREKLFTGGLFD